ncbi:MAG TPA: hypothetical protein VII23_20395, partial [Terriglobales bacterium]
MTLMKIAKSPDTVSPVSPAEQIVVMGLSPEIAAAARKYMAENLAKIQPSKPRDAAPVKSQFTFGAPVSVSSSSELIPIFDANEAADHISAAVDALQAPTMTFEQMKTLADNSAAFAEQLMPEPPTGAGVAFHIIGVLRTAPGVVTAFKKTGPTRRTGIAGSLIKFLASFGVLLTDIPGLEHGKP